MSCLFAFIRSQLVPDDIHLIENGVLFERVLRVLLAPSKELGLQLGVSGQGGRHLGLDYLAASSGGGGPPIFVRQLRGPHLRTWP